MMEVQMDIIDFHAHVLPSADHGSPSVSVSLKQMQMAKDCGVSRIIATPHFYPQKESAERFMQRRDKCAALLKSKLTNDYPNLLVGAEVLICDNIEEMPHLEQLCIEGTRVLLLELPFVDFSISYKDTIRSLICDGYTVILAHADRYKPENIDLLVDAGAKIQLNVDSLCKLFSDRHLYKWMENDVVYALGSDIHGLDTRAYRRFAKSINKIRSYASNIKKHSDDIWNSANGHI